MDSNIKDKEKVRLKLNWRIKYHKNIRIMPEQVLF